MASHPLISALKALPSGAPSVVLPPAARPTPIPMVLDTLRIADALVVFAVGWIAFRLDTHVLVHTNFRFWPNYGLLTVAGTFVAAKIFALAGLYTAERIRNATRQIGQLLLSLVLTASLIAALGFLTETWHEFSPRWLMLWLGLSFAATAAVRAGLATVIRHKISQGGLSQTIVIVGAGEYGQRLVTQLVSSRAPNVRLLGLFDDRRERVPEQIAGYPVLGTTNDLLELGKISAIDQIVIALPWSAEARLLEILHKLKSLPANISLCPDRIGFHLRYHGVTQYGPVPLVSVVDAPLGNWRGFAKTCEDRVLALAILTPIAPLLFLIALAIKLESPGPALFRQKRHGFNNHEIEVYKFRTMYHGRGDQSGADQTQRNDPRVTRIGAFLRRTSLDELPQFLNVLKGDMSIVGPRPHPIGMKTEKRLCHEIVADYAHRHRMKPGITGWAQVNGWRGATDTAEKLQRRVEHDLYYIENWSISFDLRILLLTVLRLFGDENAF